MKNRKWMSHRTGMAVLFVGVVGCGMRPAPVPQPSAPTTGGVAHTPVNANENMERLNRLRAQRSSESTDGDYQLGEGDVISVRAYGLDELNQRVRVDGDGAVTLPLLNEVPVTGRTVSEVQRDLTRRLGAFMHDPSVTVFVEEYRSQQVTVVGAVQRPGLVSQTVRNATVLDALSSAGGMTDKAGSRIYLIPYNREAAKAPGMAMALRSGPGTTVDPQTLSDAAPVMVDTSEVTQDIQRVFFTIPVRAGDVILVPNGGSFIIGGWVLKPGTYPLQPGLTLRGAISTAGGLSFPAEKGHVRIHRPLPNGTNELHDVNFAKIEAQQAPDLKLYEGDVVEVGASLPKLASWGLYKVVVDVVKVGAGIRVVP
jgi:polysaccharide export outer membrane protein